MAEYNIDDRLLLTSDQKKAFNRIKKALKDFENAGGYLLPWDEVAYPINMNNVDHICPEDFVRGDINEYIQFGNFGSGNEHIEHESCYINTRVFIKFKEQ